MNKINPEYQRHLDILSGLPGLGTYEQQVEIGDRMARRELVQVNEVWYERVDLSEEAAAAIRRAVQAKAEARPHDDEPAPEPVCGFGVGCVLKPDHSAPFHRLANGDDVDSAGRLIDRTRFLGFTSHGHPADTKTPPEGFDWPALVARCGGPGMCHECATDAERLREEADRG